MPTDDNNDVAKPAQANDDDGKTALNDEDNNDGEIKINQTGCSVSAHNNIQQRKRLSETKLNGRLSQNLDSLLKILNGEFS